MASPGRRHSSDPNPYSASTPSCHSHRCSRGRFRADNTHVSPAAGTAAFRVQVHFPSGFDLPHDQRQALRPGMTLTADLIRDRSTLFAWLVEPLRGAAARI